MQKIHTYKSGLRLIVNTMQGINSASVSVFVNTGSINENINNNGISHFIEHTMFKGTEKRTAKDIAVFADEIGANINAFTTNFYTCYYTRTIPENLENCCELLSDMLNNSKFEPEELDKERKVILEEKAMYEDDPASTAEENCMCEFYKGTPLELTIIGTDESLHKINQNEIKKYLNKFYTPSNIIIAIAGNVEYETAKKLCDKYFQNYYKNQNNKPIVNKNENNHKPQKAVQIHTKKDIEQDHICVMFPTPNIYSKKLSELNVFNTIFGGMMSSRLYQRIRENLGFVYTINSMIKPNKFGGDLCIYFATTPKNTLEAITQLKEEIELIKKQGITVQELDKAKSNFKSSLLVRSDNPTFVANNACVQLLNYGKIISIQQQVEKIEKLTIKKVNKIINEIFDNNFTISVVSKTNKPQIIDNFK